MPLFRFLFLCLSAVLLANCQKEPAFVLPAKQAPALWMIMDPVTGARGYIMGSVHMLPAGLDWITPKIRAAANKSDLLVTEIGRDTDAQGVFKALASDEPVPPIHQRLDRQDSSRARAIASGAGLTLDSLSSTESWAIAIMLSRAQTRDLAISADEGVETRLRRDAMPGKAVLALETARTQFERFDALSDDAQSHMLSESLTVQDSEKEYQRILTLWLTGDTTALDAQARAGLFVHPELRGALIDTPNRQWSAQVAVLVRSGRRPFIAIGSAHLFGPNGVFAILQTKGMIVTRVQ